MVGGMVVVPSSPYLCPYLRHQGESLIRKYQIRYMTKYTRQHIRIYIHLFHFHIRGGQRQGMCVCGMRGAVRNVDEYSSIFVFLFPIGSLGPPHLYFTSDFHPSPLFVFE